MDVASLTDDAILAELGERVARARLERELTQAALAREAGLSKRTVERMEAGHSAQLSSLIRVLRVLDLLAGLDALLPPPAPRPMEQLRFKGRSRRRASGKRDDPAEPWTWSET